MALYYLHQSQQSMKNPLQLATSLASTKVVWAVWLLFLATAILVMGGCLAVWYLRPAVFKDMPLLWNVLKKPVPPQLPIGCCFLIEHEGELILVYTRRTQIVIFTLDQSNMVWVEVEGLEDLTLFLSTSTSLVTIADKEATGAIRDMNNKIYCSRFLQDSDDALIYSMKSKSHQLDFYKSKEFLKCTWIDLTGFEFGLDSQGNIMSVTSRSR